MTFPFRSRTRCASVQMINKLLKPQLCPSARSPALLPLLGPWLGEECLLLDGGWPPACMWFESSGITPEGQLDRDPKL